MTQVFDNDRKFLTTFNNPDTPHKDIVQKQEIGNKVMKNQQKSY